MPHTASVAEKATQTADWRTRTTIGIPEAAAELGIARNSAYVAAKRGELPTIRLGSRLVVPVAALRRLLGELPEDAR